MKNIKQLLNELTEAFEQVGAKLTLYGDYMQLETTLYDGTSVLFDTTLYSQSYKEFGDNIVESLKEYSDYYPSCSEVSQTYWNWACIAERIVNGGVRQQWPIYPPYSYNGYAVANEAKRELVAA